MDTHERAIADFRTKAAWLLFLKFALAAAVGWLFAWGSAVALSVLIDRGRSHVVAGIHDVDEILATIRRAGIDARGA